MTELLFSTNGLLYVRHSFVNPRSKMLEFTMKSWDPDPWSNFISFGTQLIQLKIVQFHIHEKKMLRGFFESCTHFLKVYYKQRYSCLKTNLLFALFNRETEEESAILSYSTPIFIIIQKVEVCRILWRALSLFIICTGLRLWCIVVISVFSTCEMILKWSGSFF